MLAQQGLLRSAAFRRWYGFPDEWPLPPDKLAEQARKRGVTMFANMAPLFRRFSALGDGDFARALSGAPAVPELVYVTRWGLRDPGPPLPPPDDAPAPGGGAADAAAVAAAEPAASGAGARARDAAGAAAAEATPGPRAAATAAAAASPRLTSAPPRRRAA
jgi:hypothetical protein